MTQILLILTILANFLIGGYVFWHNSKKIVNRLFFAFTLGMIMWGGGIMLLLTTGNFIFDKVILYGGLVMWFNLAIFSKIFPAEQHVGKIVWFLAIPYLIMAAVLPFNLVITGAEIHPDGYLEPVNGPAFPFYIGTLGFYTLVALFFFFRNYFKTSGIQKLQMRYLLLGAGVFIISAFIFDVLLPFFNIFNFNVFGPVTSVVFIGFTAYAIVRHQLMDIRVVIQRGLIYTVLATLVLFFYTTTLYVLGFVFQQQTQVTAFLSAALTTLIAVFSIPVIESYFRKVTDKIFFKDKYDYKIALQELTEILHRSINLNDIITMSQLKLKTLLRAVDVHFSLEIPTVKDKKNKTVQLLDNGMRLHIPIIFEKSIKGLIVLGRKRSGDPYTNEDVKLMTTFSYQAAIALQRATLYKEVREYSRELEKKVKERTKEIEELQQAQKQMMIDISHGLQTPLTVIKGELEFLEKQMPKNKKLNVFEKSIDEVSTFIYDLLKLARLETTPKNFSKKCIALSDFLKEQVEYLTVVAKENKIMLTSSIEKNVFIAGDEKKIEELVNNLVGNAMKYMKENGERKIHITLWKRNKKAHIAICDTGIGIAQKDLSHIFSRFYRIKNNKTADIKGTGLGLAIVKRIVEIHGGMIAIKSTLGKETTFTITFPLLKK